MLIPATVRHSLQNKEGRDLLVIEKIGDYWRLSIPQENCYVDTGLLDELAGLCLDIIVQEYYNAQRESGNRPDDSGQNKSEKETRQDEFLSNT